MTYDWPEATWTEVNSSTAPLAAEELTYADVHGAGIDLDTTRTTPSHPADCPCPGPTGISPVTITIDGSWSYSLTGGKRYYVTGAEEDPDVIPPTDPPTMRLKWEPESDESETFSYSAELPSPAYLIAVRLNPTATASYNFRKHITVGSRKQNAAYLRFQWVGTDIDGDAVNFPETLQSGQVNANLTPSPVPYLDLVEPIVLDYSFSSYETSGSDDFEAVRLLANANYNTHLAGGGTMANYPGYPLGVITETETKTYTLTFWPPGGGP